MDIASGDGVPVPYACVVFRKGPRSPALHGGEGARSVSKVGAIVVVLGFAGRGRRGWKDGQFRDVCLFASARLLDLNVASSNLQDLREINRVAESRRTRLSQFGGPRLFRKGGACSKAQLIRIAAGWE